MTLSTNPPKGTQDRYPKEYALRKYIFDTWRKVCVQFGYEEYLGPLVEDIAIWEAKSGEDVGGSELTRLTNRVGEISELALRPEMTPTVTRMIVKKRNELPKPVRWFSIANFYRNERPQRGRNREFWQLNVDLFGSDSLQADIEVLIMSIELMKKFGATSDHFQVNLNHRGLVNTYISQFDVDGKQMVRLLDKWKKIEPSTMDRLLSELGLSTDEIIKIRKFMEAESIDEFRNEFADSNRFNGADIDFSSISDLGYIMETLEAMGYGEYILFQPGLMRGFDYYDGMVFEVFDKHPENNRALFGGGRYNGLADIFGASNEIPAVGFAPGDETMKLFLESWGLDKLSESGFEKRVYMPLLDERCELKMQKIAKKLRDEKNKNVMVGLSKQALGKAFQYAEKNNFNEVVIVWEDKVTIKNLDSGDEEIIE